MNPPQRSNSFRTGPDERGHFGIYGGRYVAETLMPPLLALEAAYAEAKNDPAFQKEVDGHLKNYIGRPSPLYFAERMTEHFGGAKIYFKREDLNHTGAHKVNNVLGQVMMARRMGKPRVIAETGAGMHGVATATLCAKFGIKCVVYMGEVDVARQQPNCVSAWGPDAARRSKYLISLILVGSQHGADSQVVPIGYKPGGANTVGIQKSLLRSRIPTR